MADAGSDAAAWDIYDYWAQCRRDHPVGPFDARLRHVARTRYADVEMVLRDPLRFSSRVNADTMGPVMGTMLVAMDGEEHRRYRNLVAHAFRPSALARWEDELIGPAIHRLIDDLAGVRRADLVATVTSRFPVQVIAGVIGVPFEDHGQFHAWALDMNKGPEDYPCRSPPQRAMRDYLTPIVEDRKPIPETTSSPTS